MKWPLWISYSNLYQRLSLIPFKYRNYSTVAISFLNKFWNILQLYIRYSKYCIKCWLLILICVLACTKFFRCARTSIPNMEIINKKYLIKNKNSKIIIFMRGGILSFSTNKGYKWKKFKFKIHKILFYKFYPNG